MFAQLRDASVRFKRPTRLARVTYNITELQNTDDALPMPVIGPVTLSQTDIKRFNASYISEIDLESALHIGLLITIGLVQIAATYSLANWLLVH